MNLEIGLESRICKVCLVDTPLARLVKKSDFKGGYAAKCLDCKAAQQRSYRKLNQDRCTKEYEKTISGYLMRTYRNMLSRVSGVQKAKAHLYSGLDILTKQEFLSWSLTTNFEDLLSEYKGSGYDMKLAPSIDRKNSDLGYTLENIRWVTHSENSRLGALSDRRQQ